MKISVIMPTYNDSETICESIESVRKQTFYNWQLIIMDDGSTDLTAQVVNDYMKEKSDNRIEYHFQENQDQLNAIKNSLKYANGDYVYILHSDDKLATKTSFADFIDFEEHHAGYDAYYGDIVVINREGRIQGTQHVLEYKNKDYRIALIYLWLGRNLYIDPAYYRKSVFSEKIRKSYLLWNIPYWLDLESSTKSLNIKKFDFPMFQYRVFEGNYINNELGRLNVINGELRTLTCLMKSYYIPCYCLQYYLYRCLNKLNLGSNFRPLYLKKEEKNKGKILEFVIRKRFNNNYKNNLFLDCLTKFYYTIGNDRIFKIYNIPDDLPIYYGADMRTFNQKLIDGQVCPFYMQFLQEMCKGFSIIICSAKNIQTIDVICRFLCIRPFVDIKSE